MIRILTQILTQILIQILTQRNMLDQSLNCPEMYLLVKSQILGHVLELMQMPLQLLER